MRLALLAAALLAACVIVQSSGMLLLIRWLGRIRDVLESPGVVRHMGLLLRLFMLIVVMHLVQVVVWALVFWEARQLPTLETAVYFSITTYTTVGFGDVVLGPGWRVLAGIEGLTGIILVGWSTAFVFAVVHRMYEHLQQVHDAH
jgi:hypothetical protein